MSGSELLFAPLLVCLVAVMAFMISMLSSQGRRSEGQSREIAELRGLLAAGGQVQDAVSNEVRERLSATQTTLESFKASMAARQAVDDDSRRSLRRLEAIIAGASTRGAAGENILEEAIRFLPNEMVRRDAWIKGKVVEFGLVMPGGKLMPVDSKWTSSLALEGLAQADLEASRRAQLTAQVEREVEKRIREVSQYIDPDCTTPWALAAIPDAAYSVCRAAFAEAHRRRVIVVGYSMALPYLLALYHMHLQFSRTVDIENLQAQLLEIERQVEQIEGALENKLQKAVTMLQNTYSEARTASARIKASTHALQASELPEAPVNLVLIEPPALAGAVGQK